ncbi:MAG: class I SAM-dependent DNA methyltransferase [Ilumatobacteraceae bacterium]
MTAPQRAERKRLGVWYTPPELVEAILAESVFPGARRILDPACGDGRFLTASSLPECRGVDIDPRTPFEHDDALRRDWGEETFDVVVGNPPFLAQRTTATARGDRPRLGGGPYADAAAEFLALARRLTRPGGRFGLVLPQSILAARDAASVRAEVMEGAALRWMWWSTTPMFDASVRVWAGVWEVGARQEMVRRCTGPNFEPVEPIAMPTAWSGLLTGGAPESTDGPVLGDIATFSVDFRDRYYGLVGAVGDDVDGPPLVTCGLIDPGRCHWGERHVRFARQRFFAPRVDLERLTPPMREWAHRRLVPKILVANQTRTIEAVHDVKGEWLPGVPVITCVTSEPDRVLSILGSASSVEWVHHHVAGSGLGAGTVRLSPSLLAAIPLSTRQSLTAR